ncbi:MAG: glycoside hydrolase family 3 C-terminal domain-containing protein [Flavobacteriales bacterium]|nr:glycoside hydrolase family 3 C-terminal domain-containing protein [Flavobacteriales bacterium]MDP4717675.1 glycoside hydrolase family 3 C-terminal domain-containing protein [Flavobacteriales bacterium]MDP4731782.1 glycoside hydrolase family 3 C-terminal domain-containing protein [Flavobacteriales bacterium]MDP4819239.1 glycoside hydrolase family 3 C-terminal domain-containing protein [Flavobacteriales bacterium]MDP4951598.1 glycoside hydrolase family 3 C-terminal domain-containing protein [F
MMTSKNIFQSVFILAFLALNVSCTSQKSATNDKKLIGMYDYYISKMTIEEKVGQMTQLNLDVVCEGEVYKLVEPHHLDAAKLHTALVDYHVGSILNCGGHAYPREQWHEIIGGIQKVATTETNLKIPILYGIDAIHGANYVTGSTLFPQQLAQAATFNPSLTQEGGRITAYETRAAGIPWNFSPVLDVGRNKNWSRFFETFGEDPYVCSVFGSALVLGYQGGNGSNVDDLHVAACMKHFLGYSGTRTGFDRTPAILSDIELREIYRPSFQAAIDAGALTVMINSGEINGIPVHANPKILIDLLRTEMGFKGLAVTDWEDVIKLVKNHRVAVDLKEATYLAVMAGIDMCMVPNDYDFTKYLIELVKEGRISEERLDISVRRILETKNKLGLFENAMPPSIAAFPEFASEKHKAAALHTAEESITLLENKNNILPLKKDAKIFVTGPAANSMTLLNGAWTRTWQGTDAQFDDATKNTIYEALLSKNKNVTFNEVCGLETMNKMNGNPLEMAMNADVIVVCVGELPSTELPGNIYDLELPKAQQEYVKMLQSTMKPVVLVLVENRPRIVRDIVDGCSAVVMAYQPGDFGGDALANILYGDVNPSGKLPFTYPKFQVGTSTYDHKFTETFDKDFGNKAFQPQWEFGYGLSYSNVQYENLQVIYESEAHGGEVLVRVDVLNPSERSVKESVLVFATDEVASVTPSVKKLKAFQKIELAPKQRRIVEFSISKEDLKFIGKDAQPIFESGAFQFHVGPLTQRLIIQ